jgi:hypothetical protein
VAPLETTVTPNSKDVREGGQEASPKRESGPRTTGGVGFCPLDRAVGVNPRFYLRERTRLVVLVPKHQTAMYETSN